MAGFFVVVAIIALVLGFLGSLVGNGTSGLGAIGIGGVCMLVAIYMRNDEHTTAILNRLNELSKRQDLKPGQPAKDAAGDLSIHPDQR